MGLRRSNPRVAAVDAATAPDDVCAVTRVLDIATTSWHSVSKRLADYDRLLAEVTRMGFSMVEVRVERILVHVLKSLDGVYVESTLITEQQALEWDRRFHIVTVGKEGDKQSYGKENFFLRPTFDLKARRVAFEDGMDFELRAGNADLDNYLSTRLGRTVWLEERHGLQPPGRPKGPTVVGLPSLREVANWFELPLESVVRRVRANILLDGEGMPPFWEDRLFGPPGAAVPFRIGNVRFEGMEPCLRCDIPTKDPETGEPIPRFVPRFRERRVKPLMLDPKGWSWQVRPKSTDQDPYRVAVQTSVPSTEAGKLIKRGDEVIVG